MLDDREYIYKMHLKESNITNRIYNHYFDNLSKAKKLQPKNTLIDEKNYKHNHSKLIQVLNLHYHEFKEH